MRVDRLGCRVEVGEVCGGSGDAVWCGVQGRGSGEEVALGGVQPKALSRWNVSAVSTPSAVTVKPRLCPSSMSERTIACWRVSILIGWTKLLSILSSVTGRVAR